jgi:hypothetical protein
VKQRGSLTFPKQHVPETPTLAADFHNTLHFPKSKSLAT